MKEPLVGLLLSCGNTQAELQEWGTSPQDEELSPRLTNDHVHDIKGRNIKHGVVLQEKTHQTIDFDPLAGPGPCTNRKIIRPITFERLQVVLMTNVPPHLVTTPFGLAVKPDLTGPPQSTDRKHDYCLALLLHADPPLTH